MKPPIKLRRLYAKESGKGDFVIVAEPLPAAVRARMTDAEYIERCEAERAAIDGEWRRLRSQN